MVRYYLLLFCLGTLLRAQVNAPQVGFARFTDGSVRPVLGVPASFVVGRPARHSVDAASFSDVGGILSEQGHIRLVGTDGSSVGDQFTGDREAVVNIDGTLSTAVAWLPASHSILRWDGAGFDKTDLPDSFSGKVIGIRLEGEYAKVLVLAEKAVSEVTVSLQSGNVESIRVLPGVGRPALQQKSFLVFSEENGIQVEGSDGVRRSLALNGVVDANDVAMERMASDWLHLWSARLRQDWALHITPTLLDISQLPSAAATDGSK
jgi:hypothetical protein